MKPSFCIITTTYKRPEAVLRAVSSVKSQSYQNWQHIVVIDDPTSNYTALDSEEAREARLHIIKNQQNIGKNGSVNAALNYLATEKFTGHIIFLDDDDWLAPGCLAVFADVLSQTPHPWLVSERVNANTKKSFTTNNTGKSLVSYRYHCLLKRDFYGDATHCLHFPSVQNVHFPLNIKNAEEWLYFAHVSTIHPTFLFIRKAGTLSLGYAETGLTDTYHTNREQKQNAKPIIKEIWQRQIFSPIILSYTLLRFLRSLI